MKNETLKQIIEKIKKYNLTESFKNPEDFKEWASKLNNTQIKNFLSLDINIEEIKNIKHLLINDNLLNCEDYLKKINAIKTLKNGDGCWHLFNNLCNQNFLKSKNFYKDIEMLSKANTARYGLWILGEDSFINSPYHVEDLKLLINAHDTNSENSMDWLVSESLATVAKDIDSIKSPYHQADMKLIATCGSDCLQMNHTYPTNGINHLATNKVSLQDKYHLENMQLLAKNPNLSEFLYPVMTTENIVNGKYYREEVNAIVNAKSKLTARALYYYIVRPRRMFTHDVDFDNLNYGYYLDKPSIKDYNLVSEKNDPDYSRNLIKINHINDNFIMHYISILMNKDFISSTHKNFDLKLLHITSNNDILMDLYGLMTDEDSLNSKYHTKDAVWISQTLDIRNRDILLDIATNEQSLESDNHEYDMEYVHNLDIDSLSEEIINEIYYYTTREGINDLEHKEKLEKLLNGIIPERTTNVSKYLDSLEAQINNNNSPIIESVNKNNSKFKSKILKLFRK